MGTNFYTLKNTHIGKRSVAGLYCWDCNLTLCVQGNNGIHNGYSAWYKYCPKCKAPQQNEYLENSSVGRELGFNKNKYKKKTSVKSCCSFRWAIEKSKLDRIRYVKDEYDRKFTIKQFQKILKECPIQYFDSIGHEFF